ncbi:hypothetical protein EYB53_018405 [Candidatus Chloroploca sp. M-50]|uniref:Uncharacterized protein n=1 Tax=Candidatus Chloroploca mongolica TaxID=2528176 RepID=A0ABS4DE27_9CHLR|nr:hypothetical protein [Candidatus Chloroploca mongolica]MBP1467693.1 hypothetical protein [Candidatus Chloroploca mongolica]
MSEFLTILLLLIWYAAIGYFSWTQRTPIYFFTLLAGHVSALVIPLWSFAYGLEYRLDVVTVQILAAEPVPLGIMLSSAWLIPLPALAVFTLYRFRWWFPGQVTGLLTYLVFLLYHLLIEVAGMRLGFWSYASNGGLPLGLSASVLAAMMASLISYGLLYLLLVVQRFAWTSMLIALLPAILGLSLLMYGVLGAPLWLALVLDGADWTITAGLASTLLFLVWGWQIITRGIGQTEQRYGEGRR